MRFGHQWSFQHEDTKLLLGLTAAFALLSAGAWWLWGAAGAPVMLVLLFLGLVGLLLNLHRMQQKEAEHYLRHVQALHSLYALVPFRAPLPPLIGWAASPELACTLVDVVRRETPERVLELGSGASTLVMAYALEQVGTGRILALDHERNYADRTVDLLAAHDLQDWAEVRHAPLTDVSLDRRVQPWYDLAPVEEELSNDHAPIDLLVIGGPPRETHAHARYPALPLLYDYLSESAVVVLDDAFREEEQKALTCWQASFGDLELELHDSHRGIAVLRRTGRSKEGERVKR